MGKSRLPVSTVFIVLAVVWMLSPLTASAQQWAPLGTGLYDQAMKYYDSSSVKRLPDNIVQVSVKSTSASNTVNVAAGIALAFCRAFNEAYKDVKGDYSYEIDIYELNCTTNQYRTISHTYYDGNGHILCQDSQHMNTEWAKVDLSKENTVSTALYRALCK